MTTNRTAAAALIDQYAGSKDATIKMLVSEARAMFRRGEYDKVARHLSDDSIARARRVW